MILPNVFTGWSLTSSYKNVIIINYNETRGNEYLELELNLTVLHQTKIQLYISNRHLVRNRKILYIYLLRSLFSIGMPWCPYFYLSTSQFHPSEFEDHPFLSGHIMIFKGKVIVFISNSKCLTRNYSIRYIVQEF